MRPFTLGYAIAVGFAAVSAAPAAAPASETAATPSPTLSLTPSEISEIAVEASPLDNDTVAMVGIVPFIISDLVASGRLSSTIPTSSFSGCYDSYGNWNSEPNRCDGMGCEYNGGWNGNLNHCRGHNKAIVSTAGLTPREEPTPAPTEPKPAEATPISATGAAPTPTRLHHMGCVDPNGDWHFHRRFCRKYRCQDEEGRWHRHQRHCTPHGKLHVEPTPTASADSDVEVAARVERTEAMLWKYGFGCATGDCTDEMIHEAVREMREHQEQEREQEQEQGDPFACGGMPCTDNILDPFPVKRA